jgi:hypothetical protein
MYDVRVSNTEVQLYDIIVLEVLNYFEVISFANMTLVPLGRANTHTERERERD